MSRFDLFFVILDQKDEAEDLKIAEHIVQMHQLKDTSSEETFNKETLQTFISVARKLRPQFMRESAEILKREYKKIRK